MNIGFVGLGRMGANMARRLKDRGYHVTTLFDVNRKVATDLAQELTATACPTLGDVTAGADVIFTVVSDDAAMRQIFSGDDNLLVNASGKLFINCATISPEVHAEVEQLAQRVGAETLEACMASSITQARDGSLYLMCGGSEEVFRRVEPLLRDLSSSLRFVGKTGERPK
jgi:3-hydroxyisobutyrate dehydrogenase-like beta-hydroxyacid dehydrogenase